MIPEENDPNMVQSLLDFKRKLDAILKESFLENEDFYTSLKVIAIDIVLSCVFLIGLSPGCFRILHQQARREACGACC